MKIILCATIMCIFAWSGMWAQESTAEKILSDWYGENSRAEYYVAVRADILRILRSAEKALIPTDILVDFLNEAAARAIAPARVIEALQERLDDLGRLKKLLDDKADCLRREPPGGEPAGPPPSPLRDLFSIQRRGVPVAVIASVLDGACRERKTYGGALSALKTLANIPSLHELSSARLEALAAAILESSLTPAGYSALSSFYIKGKMKNISAEEITDIIITALREGKGLIRIEQEMDRRRGR